MSTPSLFLGIDFGTCRSSMAWYNPKTAQAELLRNAEGDEHTPSVVACEAEQFLVGTAALALLENHKSSQLVAMSVKRLLGKNMVLALGGRSVRPVNLVAEILKKLKRDAEQGHFRESVSAVVLTHPAFFDQVQIDQLQSAACLAGFQHVELWPEPAAAALAYARAGCNVGRNILVFDLGAGTFDLALLVHPEGDTYKLGVAPRGLAKGGEDFDRALYEHLDRIVTQKLGRGLGTDGKLDLRLVLECRRRKEELSARSNCEWQSWLSSTQGPVPFNHTLDRATLERLIQGDIEGMVRLTRTMLDEAKALGHAVDTVVLAGGASRVPLVAKLLEEVLPLAPLPWHQRDGAVALGAAYYGATLWSLPLPHGRGSSQPQEAECDEELPSFPDEKAEDFQQFLEVRSFLGKTITRLATAFQGLGAQERARHLLQVKGRLETDTFRLMVIGEFKRGKSTLINALLGSDVLPAKLAPCTAVITEIKYGETPKAVLHYLDSTQPPLTVPVAELRRHIVIEGDDEEEASESIRQSPFSLLELFYPSPLCRNNVEIVDSPGLNEHQTRTRLALDYLASADALILVLSCQQALSQSELSFINTQLDGNLRHVFFVWNYFDALADAPNEIDSVKNRARQHLEPRLAAQPRIFYLSARSALVARKNNQPDELVRSGVPAFEAALQQFLVNERGRVKLLGPLARAQSAVDDGLAHLIPRQEKLLAQPVDELRLQFERQQPRLKEIRAQRQAMLQHVEECRDRLLREVDVAGNNLLSDLDDGLRVKLTQVNLTTWMGVTDRNKAKEVIGQDLQKWLADRLGQWQRQVLGPLLEWNVKQLEAKLAEESEVFTRNLESFRRSLTPHQNDGAALANPQQARPAFHDILQAVGLMSVGEVRHHLEAGLDRQALVQGTGLSLGVGALLAIAHVAAPLVILGVAAGGLTGYLFGAQAKVNQTRQQVADEAAATLRQTAQLTMAKLRQRVTDEFNRLLASLDAGTSILVEEVAGQVQAILDKHQRGTMTLQQELDRLHRTRDQLQAIRGLLEKLHTRLTH